MIEQPSQVQPSKPPADGEPNGNRSLHVIHVMRPRLGIPEDGLARRRRPACYRNWVRRERSSMMHRRPWSRGTGQTSASRWTR